MTRQPSNFGGVRFLVAHTAPQNVFQVASFCRKEHVQPVAGHGHVGSAISLTRAIPATWPMTKKLPVKQASFRRYSRRPPPSRNWPRDSPTKRTMGRVPRVGQVVQKAYPHQSFRTYPSALNLG